MPRPACLIWYKETIRDDGHLLSKRRNIRRISTAPILRPKADGPIALVRPLLRRACPESPLAFPPEACTQFESDLLTTTPWVETGKVWICLFHSSGRTEKAAVLTYWKGPDEAANHCPL